MDTDDRVVVDLGVYYLDVVHKAAYALGAKCSARVERRDESHAAVLLRPADQRAAQQDLVAEFERLLVDFRLRAQLQRETATIRDLIFRQAFVEADL